MSEKFELFKKTKKNGEPITCKFCHKETWFSTIDGRVYDVGGETYHVENCERRKAFYHNRALDAAESVRQRRER